MIMKWIWASVLLFQFSFIQERTQKIIPKINPELFESGEVLNLTLSGNLNVALRDRDEKSSYYPAVLSYKNPDSSRTSIKLNIKTRGHFRKALGNCQYP